MLFSHSDNSLESDISSIISIEATDQVSSKMHIVQSTNRGEFGLTGQEWFRIFPNFSESALKSEWTTLFNEKISVYYPFCVLKFVYHRINKSYSRRGCAFLIAAAVSKFSNCFTFKFEMETPQTNASNLYLVNYTATGSISKEHSSNLISHSRHLSGDRREATAKQLELSSPSNLIISSLLIHKIYPFPKRETSIIYTQPMSLERSSHSTLKNPDLIMICGRTSLAPKCHI